MTKKTYWRVPIGTSLADRLAARAALGTGGCLLWVGSTNGRGYGQIRVDGALTLVHRLAWSMANGPIPEGMHVCHRCDTPACFNAAHLFVGTNADNVADRMAKSRSADQRGVQNGCAKLTETSVMAIKVQIAAGESLRAIARRFGVGASAVAHIKAGRNWSHITGARQSV